MEGMKNLDIRVYRETIMEVLQDEENGEVTVYGTNPNGNHAYRFIGPKHWHDCPTIEEGIASAIHGMASSAHRTY